MRTEVCIRIMRSSLVLAWIGQRAAGVLEQHALETRHGNSAQIRSHHVSEHNPHGLIHQSTRTEKLDQMLFMKPSILTTSILTTALLRATRSHLVAAVLAVGVCGACVPAVHAQFGGRGGMASLFMPDYLPRDLPVFVDSLQLEEWQRPILEALLEDYMTNFKTAEDGVRNRMAQLKDIAAGTDPSKVIQLVTKPLTDWAAEKIALRAEFLENVRSQLGESQFELWPRFERTMRREKALPNGELSGETLNLFLIMRELDASPSAADSARLALDEYELSLDAALAARENLLESMMSAQFKAMDTGDSEGGVAASEAIMVRRVAVRDAQDKAIVAIRDALGAEFGPLFEKNALQRAFPQVYRPDPVTPVLDAVASLPDLTDDQKTSLNALRDQFNIEWPALQTRMADGYRMSEPLKPRRDVERMRQKAAGGTVRFTDVPEIEMLKTERETLFAKYRELIAGILNESQKNAIPGMGKPGADDGESMPRGADLRVIGPGVSEVETDDDADKNTVNPATPSADDKITEGRLPPATTFSSNPKNSPVKGAKPK